MKAQAVFEFVIASMILFSLVIYTISYLSSSFALHHDISKSADLEAKALRVSDMLAGDGGVGMFSAWPNLDTARMAGFNASCAGNDGYFLTVGRLGLNESSPISKFNRLHITVSGVNGKAYVNCGRTPVEGAASGYVTRFGFVPAPDSQLATINVTVW